MRIDGLQVNDSGNKIPLILDNIVFSLQRAGGASVYWKNLLERVLPDSRFLSCMVEREDAVKNVTRNAMTCCDQSYWRGTRSFQKRADQVRKIPVDGRALFHSSCYRLAKGRKVINITTVHDFTCMKYYSGVLKWFSFWQIKRAVACSEGLICISESTKNDMFRYLPDSKSKKITVIPHGYDSDAYVFREMTRKDKVVFIGARNVSYKNFWLAVDAVKKNSRVSLIIIGAPLTEEESKRLNTELQDRYESIVYPSAEEISKTFNQSLALLYLSDYEGFGIPVLEGMASGIPVIAGNKSSIPEVGGDGALLLEEITAEKVSSVIDKLKDDENFFEDTVRAGLLRVQEFSWDKTMESTMAFYEEVWRGSELSENE